MKRRTIATAILVALVVPLVVLAGCGSSTKTTPTTPKKPTTTPSTSKVTVTMIDFAFQPAALTIKPGTTVTWVNNGAVAHEPAGTGFDMHRRVQLKHLVEAEDVPEPAEPAEPAVAENPLLA